MDDQTRALIDAYRAEGEALRAEVRAHTATTDAFRAEVAAWRESTEVELQRIATAVFDIQRRMPPES